MWSAGINVLVPFVPYGSLSALICVSHRTSRLTDEVCSTGVSFSALVVLGLIVMYVASSNAVRSAVSA
jgi:hypothetical protein